MTVTTVSAGGAGAAATEPEHQPSLSVGMALRSSLPVPLSLSLPVTPPHFTGGHSCSSSDRKMAGRWRHGPSRALSSLSCGQAELDQVPQGTRSCSPSQGDPTALAGGWSRPEGLPGRSPDPCTVAGIPRVCVQSLRGRPGERGSEAGRPRTSWTQAARKGRISVPLYCHGSSAAPATGNPRRQPGIEGPMATEREWEGEGLGGQAGGLSASQSRCRTCPPVRCPAAGSKGRAARVPRGFPRLLPSAVSRQRPG